MNKNKIIALIIVGTIVLSLIAYTVVSITIDIGKKETCDRIPLAQSLRSQYCVDYFNKKYN